MSRLYSAALSISVAVLTGCGPTTQAATHKFSDVAQEQASNGLANVLDLFSTDAGRRWGPYQQVKGISWIADQADQYGAGRFDLSGHLLLAGFGARKLPNGKTGIDYAEIDGNEGQAGVTLNGSKQVVEDLSVKKFYFSENFMDVIQKQFPVNFEITKIADHCHQPEGAVIDGKNSFFEIKRPGQDSIYVEVWLEDGGKYSPGYTVFDFARARPVVRIRQLECMVI